MRRLRSGLFGRARFRARNASGALDSADRRSSSADNCTAFIVVDANQIAQLRYVTLGNASGANVEVLSGLQDGETIVAAPGDRELGGKQIAAHP